MDGQVDRGKREQRFRPAVLAPRLSRQLLSPYSNPPAAFQSDPHWPSFPAPRAALADCSGLRDAPDRDNNRPPSIRGRRGSLCNCHVRRIAGPLPQPRPSDVSGKLVTTASLKVLHLMSEDLKTWVSPLWFEPVFRQYLWGGRRLGEVLQKPIAATGRFAESWEVVDHGADQSTVQWGWAGHRDGASQSRAEEKTETTAGPTASQNPHEKQAPSDPSGAPASLMGRSLGDLMQAYGPQLVGPRWYEEIHAASQPPGLRGRFPLLVKWLDAQQNLSLQVHPNSQQAALLDPPDLGKSEAWYVADAAPGARVYAGLLPGVDRAACEQAIAAGRLAEVLYHFSPQAGDCIYIPAGTIHAIGAGLLVAEVQQASDTTYRLHDWDRVGDDGRPRALQIEQALAVADWQRGPVPAVIPQPARLEADSLNGTHPADGSSDCEQLVACPYFTLRRFHLQGTRALPTGRCQILICLSGQAKLRPVDGPEPANQTSPTIQLGSTVLLPHHCPPQQLIASEPATFLLASLPELP